MNRRVSHSSCCVSLILNYPPGTHQTFPQQLQGAYWLWAHLRLFIGQSFLWSFAIFTQQCQYISCERTSFFPHNRSQISNLTLSRHYTWTTYVLRPCCQFIELYVGHNVHMGGSGWKQIISDWCFYWLWWGWAFVFDHVWVYYSPV